VTLSIVLARGLLHGLCALLCFHLILAPEGHTSQVWQSAVLTPNSMLAVFRYYTIHARNPTTLKAVQPKARRTEIALHIMPLLFLFLFFLNKSALFSLAKQSPLQGHKALLAFRSG
jgi:hypothetical protein